MKNRKNKSINFLKTGILLFGMTLLFFGCKDNDQELELEQTQTIVTPTIKHTNYSELEKDTQFANLIEKLNLNQMTDVYQLKNGISAKSSSNDFTIITNSIKEVETPTSHSYNILIQRNTPTENVIENLVLQNNNGIEKSLIFKYTLKDTNVSARGSTGNNDIDVEVDEIHVSDYNGSGTGGTGGNNQTCHYETVYVETTCYGPGSSGNHYNESQCQCGVNIFTCNPPSTWSTLVEVCEDNNSGIITGTWNNGDNETNTVNTNTNTNENLAVLTTPFDHVIPEGDTSVTDCLRPNTTQLAWLNSSTGDISNMDTVWSFLNSNGCSEENKNFAKEVIEAEINNIEIIELFSDLNNFKEIVELPYFDALNNPWLDILREYAKKLEELKDKIPDILWNKMNQYLDQQLITALTKTAFKFNPDADTTKESNKQHEFQNNGEKGIGILLYEFANGTGKDIREFTNGDFWNQFFEGDRIAKIKADFENVLIKEDLTFNQFVTNGTFLESSYKFSPDHAGVLDSFEEHKNANWVQFFVGGSSVEYRPSSQSGYIDVKLINPTSRHSLLLHIGDNYDRHPQETIPLSTITLHFYIKIKIN